MGNAPPTTSAQPIVLAPRVGVLFVDNQLQDVVSALNKIKQDAPQTSSLTNTEILHHLVRVLHASARTVFRFDKQPRCTVPQALHKIVLHVTGRDVGDALPTLVPSPQTVFSRTAGAAVDFPLAVAYPDNMFAVVRALGSKKTRSIPLHVDYPFQEMLTWTLLDDVHHHTHSLPATSSAITLINALQRARAAHQAANPSPLQRLHDMEHKTAQAKAAARVSSATQRVAARKLHDADELLMLAELAQGIGLKDIGSQAKEWAEQTKSMDGASSALQSIIASKCETVLEAVQVRWNYGRVQAARAVGNLREKHMVGDHVGDAVSAFGSGSFVATTLPPLSLDTVERLGVSRLLQLWGERVTHVSRLV